MENRDPIGYSPDDVVERLHRHIRANVYGIGYTVKPTDKNSQLRKEYVVDDNKVRDILLSLRAEDYLRWEYSNDEHFKGEIVHFFQKNVLLIPRQKEDGKEEEIALYIKMTWSSKNGILFILSVHKDKLYD